MHYSPTGVVLDKLGYFDTAILQFVSSSINTRSPDLLPTDFPCLFWGLFFFFFFFFFLHYKDDAAYLARLAHLIAKHEAPVRVNNYKFKGVAI